MSSHRPRSLLKSRRRPVAARRMASSERKTAVAKTRRAMAWRRRAWAFLASFLGGRRKADARVAVIFM